MDSLNDHCVDTCLYFLHLGGIERCQAESETACFCTYTHARYQICAVPEVPTPVPEHAGYQGLWGACKAHLKELWAAARARLRRIPEYTRESQARAKRQARLSLGSGPSFLHCGLSLSPYRNSS